MTTTTRSGNNDNMEENIVTINILSTDEVYSLGKESLEQSELTIMCTTMIVWSCISTVPHSKHDYVDGISPTIIPHSKHDYADSVGPTTTNTPNGAKTATWFSSNHSAGKIWKAIDILVYSNIPKRQRFSSFNRKNRKKVKWKMTETQW